MAVNSAMKSPVNIFLAMLTFTKWKNQKHPRYIELQKEYAIKKKDLRTRKKSKI